MQLHQVRELLARPGQAGIFSTADAPADVNGVIFCAARELVNQRPRIDLFP
ncbi:MAG: hypothetical protein IH614_14295 [Desulfuromonadales bacterium]|nr:hypothetical protein [Desulfuromonadales bacterium]